MLPFLHPDIPEKEMELILFIPGIFPEGMVLTGMRNG
jgi:hypothetical protein